MTYAWDVTIGGTSLRTVCTAIQELDGFAVPRPPRGQDIELPGVSAAVQVSGMPTTFGTASVGCLIACSAEASVPAAVKAFFALCRGTGVVTLGWAGSTASARFTGGGHAVSGRTAKVTAQWTVLSDWT